MTIKLLLQSLCGRKYEKIQIFNEYDELLVSTFMNPESYKRNELMLYIEREVISFNIDKGIITLVIE